MADRIDKTVHRIIRRLEFTQIAISHRPGKTAHIAFSHQRQLQGRNIAITHKKASCLPHFSSQTRPIDMGQQTHRTIATPYGQKNFRNGNSAFYYRLKIFHSFLITARKTAKATKRSCGVGHCKTCLL